MPKVIIAKLPEDVREAISKFLNWKVLPDTMEVSDAVIAYCHAHDLAIKHAIALFELFSYKNQEEEKDE